MRRVELVFRSVGERTAELALALARKHIQPTRVHLIENVVPFSRAVSEMLRIDHDCDLVVHMDADCLILEDMRPFLEWDCWPYVDCYVRDRFRGTIHCGVHLTRSDVVAAMRDVERPEDDLAYVLRPESRLRNLALGRRGMQKALKHFAILHDHFQWHHDIFAKYALRELRSRTPQQRARLEEAMAHWDDEADFIVARRAVDHARAHVAADATPRQVDDYLGRLMETARHETAQLGLPVQRPLTMAEVEVCAGNVIDARPRPRGKIFGLGLSRTGTRSLTSALQVLGYDIVHYPTDPATFAELAAGDFDLSLLRHFDGLTDITTSPYFAQLDRLFPDSSFILTVRDKETWLRSCRNHWQGRSAFESTDNPDAEAHMQIRRLLRAAVYGCYDYQPERFSWVYDEHERAVRHHFRDRSASLLVYDLVAGQGWEPLCDFLGQPVPKAPFPHKGSRLTERTSQLEMND